MMEIAKYTPGFMPDPEDAFTQLWDGLDWVRHGDAPRREYWSNDADSPYTYGRGAGIRTYYAQPFHAVVLAARAKLFAETGVYYEGCFLNGYENERDWLGWHEDDDPGIDHSKPIAIVTLYDHIGRDDRVRSIQFREKLGEDTDGKRLFGEPVDQPLEQGSLCVMGAGMQQSHQHRIPKASFKSRPRISLTFRSLL